MSVYFGGHIWETLETNLVNSKLHKIGVEEDEIIRAGYTLAILARFGSVLCPIYFRFETILFFSFHLDKICYLHQSNTPSGAINTFGISTLDGKVLRRIFSEALDGLLESDLLHHGWAAA